MTQQSKQLFWKFSNAFTKELRDTVIKGMDNGNLRPAETVKRDLGKDELTATEDKDIRDASIGTIVNKDINDHISSMMIIANKRAGWDFDITVNEKTQFIKYKSPGGHFRPHSDTSFQGPTATFQWKDDPPNEGFKVTQIADAYLLGSVRKISSTLLLNDEFSGGGMSLYYMALNDKENASWSLGIEEVPLDLKAGDLIFFPSGVWHAVNPVTDGTRYALVTWFGGPPIK